MKKIFSILFALVLVVSLTWVACVGDGEPTVQQWLPDVHGEVTFSQLCWMASPEEALYPHSNVGAVEFTFLEGAGEWLLDEHGGGWLNVVIDTTAAGGAYQWSVQNLYLTYPDLDYLLGSTPSVQFSLGLDGETPIESLEAAVFLSSGPLEEQPATEELFTYTVCHMPYLVGGSADSDIPLTIGPFIGTLAKPVRTARIRIPTNNVTKINEAHNMCARGAAARGIAYLNITQGLNLTDAPQAIYDGLVNAMNITGNMTTAQKILAGKNSYCASKGLNITSEIVWKTPIGDPSGGTVSWENLTKKIKDALDNGCAVEIWVGWSSVSDNGTGHMAMVTEVTDFDDGSADIKYVDDPTQGDGKPENSKERTIHADSAGNFTDGRVEGSMIQSFH